MTTTPKQPTKRELQDVEELRDLYRQRSGSQNPLVTVGIGKDLIPGGEGLVGGDHQAVPLVAVADQLEQHRGFGLILADVGQIIEDDQVELVQLVEGGSETEVATRGLEALDHVGGPREQHPVAVIDQGAAEGGGDVAFAGAAGAKSEDGGTGPDPMVTAGQSQDMRLAEPWCSGEVEGSEGFAGW